MKSLDPAGVVVALAALVGAAIFANSHECAESTHRECKYECDKAVQERVLLMCLEKLPNGPERLAASGNDWDEVVAECRQSASDIACKYNCFTVKGWGIDQ